ncbi:MAG: hypothetical protein ACE5FI_12730 [Anaerolineales bacterium]
MVTNRPVAQPSPTAPAYELDVVIFPAPSECGPEAAITLAQTQSDLALAAAANLEPLEAAAAGPTQVAAVGQAAFGAALELMAAYRVPDCLAPAHALAVQFFQERRAGYEALAVGAVESFERHLAQGEVARQAMTAAVNEVLAGAEGRS